MNNFIGISVNNTGIKIASLKNRRSFFVVENLYHHQSLIPFNKNVSLADKELIKKNIELSLNLSRSNIKNIVLSFPETIVYTRLITIPFVNEKEIEEAVFWSVKPMLPVDVDLLNISFIVVQKKFVNNLNYLDVYVVAINKDIVDNYINIFEDLNLNLLAIETESVAISRLLYFLNNKILSQDTLIFDFGSDTSNLIISKNGYPIFSQSFSIGSNTINKSISADFGIDFIQSEKIKREIGIDTNNSKVYSSISPILEIIASEISKLVIYYKEKLNNNSLNQLVIAGGGSALKNLDIFLSSKFNFKVIKSIDLYNRNLLFNKNLDIDLLPHFEVPIGLSLKGYV